jgi:hypothetical protein
MGRLLFLVVKISERQKAKNSITAVIVLTGRMVGDARFELATPWTQTKCATKLR